MELKGAWKDQSPFIKILLLIIIMLVLTTIFTFLASFLVNYLYGVNIVSDPNALNDYSRPEVLASLKIIQIVTSFGLFILPPLLAAYIASDHASGFLGLNKSASPASYFFVLIAMLSALPFINLAVEWNEKLNMPEMFKGIEEWMRSAESKAAELTQAFLHTRTIEGLIINIIMIALIPAIGEELFFRGYLQRLFTDWFKNAHWAIIVTAIIFSTFHMQFFGFLPRVLLGVMLGYFLFWSKSLWLPIVAHFFNNAAAVIVAYLHFNGHIPFDGNELGVGEEVIWSILASLVITSAVLYFIYRQEKPRHRLIE